MIKLFYASDICTGILERNMRCQRADIGSVKQFDHGVTFPSTAGSIGCAVNDDEISVRVLLANRPRALIFRALTAGKGRRAVLEFDHDISFRHFRRESV